MNNQMLSFSGPELSRLRTLVGAVEHELAQLSATPATTDAARPKTALDMTWSRLIEMLDLGSEPEMRTCPQCRNRCQMGATRCGHCWTALPAIKAAA
jgi:hypothetical protein